MVTDVILSRLMGSALMSSPLITTVWSRCAGRLNSDTPISLKAFLPMGAVVGMSLAAGAFALLGAGSVALVSVQLFGVASFRQPVTLTISTLLDAGAACARPSSRIRVVMGRMIPPVRDQCFRLARLVVAVIGITAASATAHDLEKTQVVITFAADGSFVADVANDPAWLKLRLESIPGPFADRVVFWVDGREIRPESVEFKDGEPAVNRLRGRVPTSARTLRWFYGLVIDPYPLTIRRADGRAIVEEIQGNAWSGTIDLSGQFRSPVLGQRSVGAILAGMLLLPLLLRVLNTKDTKVTKEKTCTE